MISIKSRSYSTVTVFEVAGRVDAYSVPRLRTQLQEVSGAQSANIVVNLASVSFLDSNGLAVLVQGMRSCRDSGGDLRLASPTSAIRMILELTRLDTALDVFVNESEAVASFAN